MGSRSGTEPERIDTTWSRATLQYIPRFDSTFINGAVRAFRAAGGDDVVVAYGDGDFTTSMKGMVGGGSAHKRLMALLSQKMRVVFLIAGRSPLLDERVPHNKSLSDVP